MIRGKHHPFLGAALAAAALSVFPSHAQETAPAPGEVEALRREIEALKAQIEALRARLEALAAATPAAPAGPASTAPPPVPTTAAPTRSPGLMNPAISAVFQLIGNTSTSERTGANGFDLSEAEVAFESVVDPYTKVNLFLSFPAGETPEVEEGTVTTMTLPAALQLKGGRFKSDFGRWNTLHTHAFPTVERPAVLDAFFGPESLTNDGLSLSWLIPNPWGLFLESVSEAGTARPGPAFNSAERALTWTEHLAASFNPTANASIETWATQISVQNWSRIFDFGSSTTNNLLMAWTQGTNLGIERVAFKIGATENNVDNTMQPYTLGQQFHIVMTVDDTGGPGGQTQIRVYKDGVYRGTLNTNYNLNQLVETSNFIACTVPRVSLTPGGCKLDRIPRCGGGNPSLSRRRSRVRVPSLPLQKAPLMRGFSLGGRVLRRRFGRLGK